MIKVSNKEWNNLFNCLVALPGTDIRVNLGTPADPQLLQRGWTSKQISVFQRNKALLKKHNATLVEKQQYIDKLRKQSISSVINEVTTGSKKLKKKTVSTSIENLTQLQSEHRELLMTEVELPELEKIPASEMKDYEFTGNEFIGAFWEYMVDLDK